MTNDIRITTSTNNIVFDTFTDITNANTLVSTSTLSKGVGHFIIDGTDLVVYNRTKVFIRIPFTHLYDVSGLIIANSETKDTPTISSELLVNFDSNGILEPANAGGATTLTPEQELKLSKLQASRLYIRLNDTENIGTVDSDSWIARNSNNNYAIFERINGEDSERFEFSNDLRVDNITFKDTNGHLSFIETDGNSYSLIRPNTGTLKGAIVGEGGEVKILSDSSILRVVNMGNPTTMRLGYETSVSRIFGTSFGVQFAITDPKILRSALFETDSTIDIVIEIISVESGRVLSHIETSSSKNITEYPLPKDLPLSVGNYIYRISSNISMGLYGTDGVDGWKTGLDLRFFDAIIEKVLTESDLPDEQKAATYREISTASGEKVIRQNERIVIGELTEKLNLTLDTNTTTFTIRDIVGNIGTNEVEITLGATDGLILDVSKDFVLVTKINEVWNYYNYRTNTGEII